ncbi:MAG: translation initiation factor 2 subunit beta, partial [Thermoproteales archaeon]|nr:translation initiation factor 2 subunit beta [Thermoproteales archaeon]
FLLKELAAPGSLEGNMAVIQGEFNYRRLNSLLQRYIKIYVFCPVCNNPDTFLIKDKRVYFLKCGACGAVSSVPPLV